jgi:hypothetical protein
VSLLQRTPEGMDALRVEDGPGRDTLDGGSGKDGSQK